MQYRLFGSFRLFLAVLVMCSHGVQLAPELNEILPPVTKYGPISVFVFFVLSGFVITEAAIHFYCYRPFHFLANRFVRLYPTYIVALGFTIIFLTWRTPADYPNLGEAWRSFQNLTANLVSIFPTVFVTDFLLDIDKRIDLISINWALRVEFAFYFLVAAVLFGARWWPSKHGLVVLCLLAIIAHVFFYYLAADLGPVTFYASFVPYFMLGVAWAMHANSLSEGGHWNLILVISFVLAMLQSAFYPARTIDDVSGKLISNTLAPAFLWIALVGVMYWLSNVGMLKYAELDRKAGELSYPIYLMHMPAFYFVKASPFAFAGMALISFFLASFALAIMAAWVVSAFFDRLRDALRGATLPEVKP